MEYRLTRNSCLTILAATTLIAASVCWSTGALAQTATATQHPVSLSDVDPPMSDPSVPAKPPLPRASGAELRNQAIERLRQKFNAADTAHTGAITASQASQAHMGFVASHFAEIDTSKKGSVTFSDIQRYLQR
jgi:hypothetical protein